MLKYIILIVLHKFLIRALPGPLQQTRFKTSLARRPFFDLLQIVRFYLDFKVDILKFPEWYNVIQISQGMYFNFVNFRRKSKIPKSLILLSTRSFLAKFWIIWSWFWHKLLVWRILNRYMSSLAFIRAYMSCTLTKSAGHIN